MPSGWILNFDLCLQGEGETEQVCGEKLLGTRRASQQIWQTPATEIREVSWRAAGRRRQISRRPPVISPAPSATESAIVRVYNSYADVLLDANNLWMSDIGICQKKMDSIREPSIYIGIFGATLFFIIYHGEKNVSQLWGQMCQKQKSSFDTRISLFR